MTKILRVVLLHDYRAQTRANGELNDTHEVNFDAMKQCEYQQGLIYGPLFEQHATESEMISVIKKSTFWVTSSRSILKHLCNQWMRI